jgi:hypothetical protein
MNFFSAYTSEVFRPLATILIPGAIGISTWLIALIWRFKSLETLITRNHTEASLVLLLAMIFAGLVFEDFGSRWEGRLDGIEDKKNGRHIIQWYEYLKTSFRADPIGRRYLRTLVLRLKFELGVAFAMVSAALGTVWLVVLRLSFCEAMWIWLVCICFCGWGLYEAKGTHQTLAKGRAALLEGVRVVD